MIGVDELAEAVDTQYDEVESLLGLNDGDRPNATRDWLALQGIDVDALVWLRDLVLALATDNGLATDGRGLFETAFELGWVAHRDRQLQEI